MTVSSTKGYLAAEIAGEALPRACNMSEGMGMGMKEGNLAEGKGWLLQHDGLDGPTW